MGISFNLSEKTVKGYMAVLGSAFSAVGLGEAGPSGVTTAQLRGYGAALQARGLAPRTVADHVTVVKRFFGFLVQAGYLTVDPSRGLPVPKVGRRLPKTLSIGELEQVFSVMDDTTLRRRRDKVFFQLTYAGGLRMGEVTHVRVKDIDWGRVVGVSGEDSGRGRPAGGGGQGQRLQGWRRVA